MSEFKRNRKLLEQFGRLKDREKGEELLRLLPQGEGSGLDADTVDKMHAEQIIEEALARIGMPSRRKGPTIGGGAGGVTDHGALTGLADDDHTQYLLINGTRAMTGDFDVGSNNIKNISRVETDLIPDPNNTYLLGWAAGGKWFKEVASYIHYVGATIASMTTIAYFKTYSTSASAWAFYSYDTAFRRCMNMINGRVDIERAGDITMLDQRMMQFGTYTDAQRPAAGTAGRWIFNTDDGMPNYDDGVNWRDINGNIT